MTNNTPGSVAGSVSGSVAPTPERSSTQASYNHYNNVHGYFTPQQHHRILSTSLATPLPTPPLTAGFPSDYSSGFSLPLPLAPSGTYNGAFVTPDALDDVFGTSATAATPDASFGLDMEMGMPMGTDMRMDAGMHMNADNDMELEMEMDLARLTRTATDDTLPQFQPSTPMTPIKPFTQTPSSSYPPLPSSTGGRIASLGLSKLSSLNIDGMDDKNEDSDYYHNDMNNRFDNEFGKGFDKEDDDLFGGHDVFYGGDATMSSPSMSHTTHGHSQSSGFQYPDPISYASMPPVSAAPAQTAAGPLPPPPFTLPMPAYAPKTYGELGSPARRQQAPSELPELPALPEISEILPLPHSSTKINPNDWRARLRFCEQAPNKALLEASMVRLLDFSDTMDERELAERRAANLRFDKIREQRLKDRNNEAAKRSRQRKVARIEAAEQQIARLRRERAQLVGEVASLRRRLASGSMVVGAGESTRVRKLRPTRSMAKLSRMGIEEE